MSGNVYWRVRKEAGRVSFDLKLFSSKLLRYREQMNVTVPSLARATGIPSDRLTGLEAAEVVPTGDEILILADFYRCDYKFFISNERVAPFEETEALYRQHGDEFSRADRRSVQDFLFLCECEQSLMQWKGIAVKPKKLKLGESAAPKQQAAAAAAALRKHLGLSFNELDPDIYHMIRRLGIHVFRRRLANSKISGVFIKHPTAGPCILVNYSEDVFRQRFTAAHELGHAIFDADEDFVVSFAGPGSSGREVRANLFASRLLLPPDFLRAIPEADSWDADKLLHWSIKMKINPQPLCYALQQAQLLAHNEVKKLESVKLPRAAKSDPEVPPNLSPNSQERIRGLLQRGLSRFFVRLCFDAYTQNEVSAGRLAEMLLCDEEALNEIAELYGVSLAYAD